MIHTAAAALRGTGKWVQERGFTSLQIAAPTAVDETLLTGFRRTWVNLHHRFFHASADLFYTPSLHHDQLKKNLIWETVSSKNFPFITTKIKSDEPMTISSLSISPCPCTFPLLHVFILFFLYVFYLHTLFRTAIVFLCIHTGFSTQLALIPFTLRYFGNKLEQSQSC